MRLRDPIRTKHIHSWRLYTPEPEQDDQQAMLFNMPPSDFVWTYRRCDCGHKMRCKTSDLAPYPKDFRAYADETWQPVL